MCSYRCVILYLKVITNSKINKIDYFKCNEEVYNMKIRISEIPQNGRANDKIIVMLSKFFLIPKTNIFILRGYKSNNKILRINELQDFFIKRLLTDG
ncbi:MAG: hypothetical protein ACI8ZF_000179 [Candidatus Midichloriaceae bacterium]|jgi:uncharacterized protein (TIGR00251 family)